MSDTSNLNGWREWSKYVLKELERNNADHEKILVQLNVMQNEITALKVKAGIWGFIGGAIPVIAAVLLNILGP